MSVNRLAERHAAAESVLTEQLAAAHEELRRERDGLLAVRSGLDVVVGVVEDAGRILPVNPAVRQELAGRSRTPLAAGRSICSVFDAEGFLPLLRAALDGQRPAAVVGGDTAIRLVRSTGPDEPAKVLIVGAPTTTTAAGPATTSTAFHGNRLRRPPGWRWSPDP